MSPAPKASSTSGPRLDESESMDIDVPAVEETAPSTPKKTPNRKRPAPDADGDHEPRRQRRAKPSSKKQNVFDILASLPRAPIPIIDVSHLRPQIEAMRQRHSNYTAWLPHTAKCSSCCKKNTSHLWMCERLGCGWSICQDCIEWRKTAFFELVQLLSRRGELDAVSSLPGDLETGQLWLSQKAGDTHSARRAHEATDKVLRDFDYRCHIAPLRMEDYDANGSRLGRGLCLPQTADELAALVVFRLRRKRAGAGTFTDASSPAGVIDGPSQVINATLAALAVSEAGSAAQAPAKTQPKKIRRLESTAKVRAATKMRASTGNAATSDTTHGAEEASPAKRRKTESLHQRLASLPDLDLEMDEANDIEVEMTELQFRLTTQSSRLPTQTQYQGPSPRGPQQISRGAVPIAARWISPMPPAISQPNVNTAQTLHPRDRRRISTVDVATTVAQLVTMQSESDATSPQTDTPQAPQDLVAPMSIPTAEAGTGPPAGNSVDSGSAPTFHSFTPINGRPTALPTTPIIPSPSFSENQFATISAHLPQARHYEPTESALRSTIQREGEE